MVFTRAPGVLIEPVGDVWAAFSARSGETLLLNDEAAAILEVLTSRGRSHPDEVCRLLAADAGQPTADVSERLVDAWTQLTGAGLLLPSKDLDGL